MDRPDLERLTKEQLIELVLRLQLPPKTSRTSSKPPSTDRKARRDSARPGGAKPGHEGHNRVASGDFDRVVDHFPDQCPGCGTALSADLVVQAVISEHDKIDLPVITPFIERHRRLSVTCPCCGLGVTAPLPAQARGTPFGPRIHAVATYLKTFQAFSYERLEGAFNDMFGLKISQGGLMNMLRRTQLRFVDERNRAIADLRQAKVVACDETGVRIEGSNAYHWVFRCDASVVHQASPTRGAVVVRTIMDGHRPQVWCSDRYGAQQGHADAHQTCLAHLARYVTFAMENSQDLGPLRLNMWLHKAFGLARDVEGLAVSTITSRRRALQRSLEDILNTPSSCPLAKALQNKFRRAKDQLLTFASWPGQVEPTNNGCERALRPAVIQRKVTNGYRAMWAAQGEADVRTVVDTARIQPAGANAFDVILRLAST